MAAVQGAGLASKTAFVLASDHGFANVTRQLNPRAWLREAGLLGVDDRGRLVSWRAATQSSGGLAYVYINGSDELLARRVSELFTQRAATADSGIAHVFDRAEIAQRGGDPAALLALAAEPGAAFGDGSSSYESPPSAVATHGYDPERPEMRASLLVIGPGIKPGVLPQARLIDIAPTIAQWLSLSLPGVDGRSLALER